MRSNGRFTSRQSQRFIERRNSRVIVSVVLLVVCFVLFIFSLVQFSKLPLLAITSVTIHGADPDISPSLQMVADQTLEGTYFGVFPKASILFYPRAEISRAIHSASARVETVRITLNGIHALDVVVTEKTPTALVCASLPDFSGGSLSLDDNNNCYFADASGFIFKHGPSFSGNVYHRYYAPELADVGSSEDSIIGLFATSSDEFAGLQSFYSAIEEAHIVVYAVLIKNGGEYEMYARNIPFRSRTEVDRLTQASSTDTDTDTVVIYFNNARPFSEELLNLLSFWNRMADEGHVKGVVSQFEYIDLRYGSNIFYRKL